jgi:thymidylate kinase
MGPPGAGKTTICELAMKRLKKQNTKFIYAGDIRNLLKARFLPATGLLNYHKEIFNHYLKYLADLDNSEADKIKDIRFYITELECDAISSSINENVFNDEGLSHHISKLLILMAKTEQGQSYIKEYLSNRIIVFLDLSESVILERNKHRLQTQNQIWGGFKGKTDNQILELIRNDKNIKKELCELLCQLQKGSVLTITDSDENSKGIDMIEDAIREHIMQKNQKHD